MATVYQDLSNQTELDVKTISDVRTLLKNEAQSIELLNKFEHNGVVLFEIKKRHVLPAVKHRVLVLRQSDTQRGTVVLMRYSESKVMTTHGLDLQFAGGIHDTHWCSGLAIKRVPTRNGYSKSKRNIFDYRDRLSKNLLKIIRNDEDWKKQKWNVVEVNPDYC
jgi:hypothetical protein